MKNRLTEPSLDETIGLSVSGRLCLFGEHSDWAAQYGVHPGYCIVLGTDQCIRASAQACGRFLVKTVIPNTFGHPSQRTRQINLPWCTQTLRSAAQDQTEFFRYCAGVAHEFLTQKNVPGAVDIHATDMDLPLKKGVSSSAAICVLVASAFNKVYKLHLSLSELMELAYRGERLTGSQCGRMDQACIYGKTPVLLTFEEPEGTRVEPIHCADKIPMFFVDLGGKKDTVRILRDLQTSYSKSRELQKALGQENEKIIRLAHKALLYGDAKTLGFLMNQAQTVFDRLVAPHSPEELRSPLLHMLLNYEPLLNHTYGGKGVGSQGDGTAQFVARSEGDRDAAIELLTRTFPHMRCFPLTVFANAQVLESTDRPINANSKAS